MKYTWQDTMQGYTAEEWMDFAFFSANLQHVLQVRDLHTQRIYFEKSLRFSEHQAIMASVPDIALSPALREQLCRPALIVTFHYGAYRTVPLSLLDQGYALCVLVSRDVLDEHHIYYRQVLGRSYLERLVFAEADDPHLFFKLRRYVAAGYHVLCYADGGAGVVAGPEGHTHPVRLGEACIAARSGFAHMAYLLKLPVHLLMDPIATGRDRILDGTAYHGIGEGESRAQYVEQVMTTVYDALSQTLQDLPEAWECWFYLHRTMPPRSATEQWPAEVRFVPLRIGADTFVLDKALYKVYPLPEGKYNALLRRIWHYPTYSVS